MIEQEDFFKTLGCHRQVVGGHQNGHFHLFQVLQKLKGGFLGGGVYGGERLVHQKDMGFLRQGARQESALLLPTRKVANRLIGQLFDAHLFQAALDNHLVFRRRAVQPADFPEATHHYHIAHSYRKAPIHLFTLGNVGYTVFMLAKRLTVDANTAAAQRQQPDQGFEQGRFSRPVGPDHRYLRSMWDLKSNVIQGRVTVIADRNVVQFQAGGFT